MHDLFAMVAGDNSTIYLGWGGFTIQLGNFIVIAAMVILFVLALVLPFPAGRRRK
jgi:large-conductance mechanosensitive channel